ncbi:hydrogenase expression/formation protein HypE [Sedimentibacter sp. B4]|uniref:hydrogenase expression/formation protein HypE n=1 Tax=Sedimentibacter sp. B4 TaxID=304766 RepID=UPI0002E698D8|nr:hydrogenase expression/formation protein HypE [Sedimentibacter sp. B4]
MENAVTLRCGDGGKYTNSLIKDVFYRHFGNELLTNSMDAAVFDLNKERLAFTTDSFVVKPLFFPGGDIGKLAVCGTINDLSVSGAKPLYLSCSVIIEEGFDIKTLTKIAESIGDACKKTGVKIITGDTKVVEKGSVDGIFINTSGIGVVLEEYNSKPIIDGDCIIITGGIAEHGTTIAVERYNINIEGKIQSDCMPLNNIIEKLQKNLKYIKIMKDPTRGGVATALNEIAEKSNMGVILNEESIPIEKEIKSVNEMLGLDPLYLACEGRMIIVAEKQKSKDLLEEIKCITGCENSTIIGNFTCDIKSKVLMETVIGGKRIIGPLEENLLPRIC